MEKVRVDCFELNGAEVSLEERLLQAWRLPATGADPGKRYDSVENYDPVLRSHCRLEE
jgi:hypothetical protein